MNAILEALVKLDILNDNHWTNDGLPRLEPLRMLVGNQGLSREDVTKAAPGFSRQTPKLGDAAEQANAAATSAAPTPPTAAGNVALLPLAGVAQAAAATSVEAGGDNGKVQPEGQTGAEVGGDVAAEPISYPEDDVPSLEQELAAAQERMAELEFHKVQVDRAHAEGTAYVDGLIRKIEAAKPTENSQSAIRQYLDSQSAHYEQRAVQTQRWRDAKIDLKTLIPQVAPIDAKLGARNREQYRG